MSDAPTGAPPRPATPTAASQPPPSWRRDPLGRLEHTLGPETGWLLAVAAVTLLAAGLRLLALRRVALNPFYDAAVRSMGLSWHNFFFGAFDPSAQTAIDKPPVDLWLQVASVKLLGFKPLALKLPAIAAATLAVPLLYDAVRRMAGRTAGLIAALALAVMPISVLTSRSDTMDSLMMALLVLSAWLVIRAGERRRLALLALAAVALGLAFNTKLLEALIAAPALALLTFGVGWGSARARAVQLGTVTVVFLATALIWVTTVSLVPRHDRPYPIGSRDGTVWNAVFVFNGTDRLFKPARPEAFGAPGGLVTLADARPAAGLTASPTTTTTSPASTSSTSGPRRRARASKSPVGPIRLFQKTSLDYGGLVGVMLLPAILFGVAGLLLARPVLLARGDRGARALTIAGAGTAAVALWLLTGYVVFSFTGRLHPRYLEAFTPAVAAGLGAGLAAVGARVRDPRGALVLVGGVALTAAEVAAVVGTGNILRFGEYAAIAIALALAVAAAVALLVRRRGGQWSWWWLPGLVTAGAVAAVLAYPLARDVRLIRDHSSDEATSPLFSPGVSKRLSSFLRAHQAGARYEFAAAAPTIAAPVLTRDVRPILLLTSNEARPLLSVAQLQKAVASGQVRYVLTRGSCPVSRNRRLPACSALVEWVKANGVDISGRLGLHDRGGVVYAVGAAASSGSA